MSRASDSRQSEVSSKVSTSSQGREADVQTRVEIEKEIKVTPPSLLSIHPLRALYDACRYLIKTHARRLPLIDKDSQTGAEVVISVLTQYRVLKFIATNVCQNICLVIVLSVRQCGFGRTKLTCPTVPRHYAVPDWSSTRTGYRNLHRPWPRGRTRQSTLPPRHGHHEHDRL